MKKKEFKFKFIFLKVLRADYIRMFLSFKCDIRE